ncbi:MAG: glycosyltransferase family 2 protein [Clostridia bacterium]|nr:glycosyltransferase family 2 protein [Clostridia bacterium]
MTKISVVVPLYNEEKVINECYTRIKNVLSGISMSHEIIFVNDGSRDKTEALARSLAENDGDLKLINFSRNFGHQTAITAGLDFCEGDVVVIMDADMQDPPELIPQMIEKWREGYEVVYGKRAQRRGESAFKLITAKIFYRFLKLMTSIDIPLDTGDFRLIDKKVVKEINKMRENNRYVRGLMSFAGFKHVSVEYIRQERFAGEAKYSLSKMLKLASDGIISFSNRPLKLSYILGSITCLGAVIYFFVNLYRWEAMEKLPYTILLLLQGFILICIGILGEYVGRIYDECKGRPIYIIKDTVGLSKPEK